MTRDDGRDEGARPAGGEQRPGDDEVWAGLVASFNAPDEPVGRWPASEDVDDDPDGPDTFSYEDGSGPGDDAGPGEGGPPEGGPTEGRPGDGGSGDGGSGDAGPTEAGPREGRVLRPVLGAPFGVPAAPPPVPPAQQPADEGDHYVPPPPPPIPRGDAVSRAAWAGALGGPALLMLAALAGLGLPPWLVGLCVVGFVAGFVTLVVRLRGHDPYDPDDGAVV